jgi:hypothetical protein
MQIERPQEVSDAIGKLLREGTVEELKSEKGRFLRLFMTADEVYRSMDLRIADAKGFDGSTCDYCRGDYRFSQCGKCHGTFDNVPASPPDIAIAREAIAAHNASRNTGTVRAFFDRWKDMIHATR